MYLRSSLPLKRLPEVALFAVLIGCAPAAPKNKAASGRIAPQVAATSPNASPKSKYPDFAVPRLEGVTKPGLPAVTGRIQVDQFGYLPDSAKVAVITNPKRGYNTSDTYQPGAELLVRQTPGDKVVFKGA